MRSSVTGSIQLALAGVAFTSYPLLRGYGAEVGLGAAMLYARPAWVYAHVLGMIGFVLLAAGLSNIEARSGRWATWGAFALLPYYGAEAFGLHALGVRILQTGDADMVEVAEMFRYQPVAVTIFGVGLLVIAAVGVRLVVSGVRALGVSRWGLLLTGAGLAAYLPQFFLPGPARVVHGLVLGVGLVLLAVGTAISAAGRGAESITDTATQRVSG